MTTESTLLRGALIAAALVFAGVVRVAGADDSGRTHAPERLSETGLYTDITSGRVDARNLTYEPQYPLWTDGAAKLRWIQLPHGATIDARDTDAWVFPVGTKLWKEFAFGGRRIETRMLWHTSRDEWVFASYVWNDEQTDALLAPDAGIRNHTEIAPGIRHSIPSQAECRSCHDSGGIHPLGFNALQLSDDRDPLAPHAQPLRPGSITVSALDRLGLLSPPRRDLVENPPRIRARSPRERAALGYLSANCGSCHNTRGSASSVGLVLAPGEGAATNGSEPAFATAVDVAGDWVVPGVSPDRSRRIAPGSPESSSIVYRMSSRRPSSQMPPLGSGIVDTDAIALIRAWIAEDLVTKR